MKLIFFFIIISATIRISAETLESQYGLPEGLIAKIEAFESPFGTGTKFAIDVTRGNQYRALHEIARRIGHPAHRIRSNYCGAIGVMQIKPATFLQFAPYGYDPENPRHSREVAARYLGFLIKRYGLKKALQKYSGNSRYINKILEDL